MKRWTTILWATVILYKLTGLDKQVIYINPEQVVSLRSPRAADYVAQGVKCIIHTTDGKYIAVLEECDKFVVIAEPDR